MENEIIVGEFYKHFKGNIYKVLSIAVNTETLEKMVIYQDASNPEKIWARPYDMFASPVDKTKYPEVKQQFRFEIIKSK